MKIVNIYKLCFDVDKWFCCNDVKDVIDRVLESYFKEFLYDFEKCKSLFFCIVDEIKDNVKVFGFERFKFVCVVIIG